MEVLKRLLCLEAGKAEREENGSAMWCPDVRAWRQAGLVVCSCSCEFCHVLIWILRDGSSALNALLSVCLFVCVCSRSWLVGGRRRLRLRPAGERIVMRRRRGPPSAVTTHDHLMWRACGSRAAQARWLHQGAPYRGCVVKLDGALQECGATFHLPGATRSIRSTPCSESVGAVSVRWERSLCAHVDWNKLELVQKARLGPVRQ